MSYKPKENGKFFAIEIDSKKVYLGNASAQSWSGALYLELIAKIFGKAVI